MGEFAIPTAIAAAGWPIYLVLGELHARKGLPKEFTWMFIILCMVLVFLTLGPAVLQLRLEMER